MTDAKKDDKAPVKAAEKKTDKDLGDTQEVPVYDRDNAAPGLEYVKQESDD